MKKNSEKMARKGKYKEQEIEKIKKTSVTSIIYLLVFSLLGNSIKGKAQEKDQNIANDPKEKKNERYVDLDQNKWKELYKLFEKELQDFLSIQNETEFKDWVRQDEYLNEVFHIFSDENGHLDQDKNFQDIKSLMESIKKIKNPDEVLQKIKQWMEKNPENKSQCCLFFLIPDFIESNNAKEILKKIAEKEPYLAFLTYHLYKNKILGAFEILETAAQKYRKLNEIERYIDPEEEITKELSQKEQETLENILKKRRSDDLESFDQIYEKAKENIDVFFEKNIENFSPEIIGKIFMKLILDDFHENYKEETINYTFRKNNNNDFYKQILKIFASKTTQCNPKKRKTPLPSWYNKILKSWEYFSEAPESEAILGICGNLEPETVIDIFENINNKENELSLAVLEFSLKNQDKEEKKILKQKIENLKNISEKNKQELEAVFFFEKEIDNRNEPEIWEKVEEIINKSIAEGSMYYQNYISKNIFIHCKNLKNDPNIKKLLLKMLNITPITWGYGETYLSDYYPYGKGTWAIDILKEWIKTCGNIRPSQIENLKISNTDEKILLDYLESMKKKFEDFIGSDAYPQYENLGKDPALLYFDIVNHILKKEWIPEEYQENKEREIEFKIFITRNLYLQGVKKEEINEEKIKEEIKNFFEIKKEFGEKEVFNGRNIALCANNERWTTKDAYLNNPFRFGKKATRNALEKRGKTFEFFRAQNTPASMIATKEKMLKKMEETPPPFTDIFDGHGADSISFMGDISSCSPYTNEENAQEATIIRTKDFIKSYKKRCEKFGKELYKNPDIYIFVQCVSSTYLRNIYAELEKEELPLPIIIGASEYQQFGLSNPNSAYGNNFFTHYLNLNDDNKSTTIKNLMENEQNGSIHPHNAVIYVPTQKNKSYQISKNESGEQQLEKKLKNILENSIMGSLLKDPTKEILRNHIVDSLDYYKKIKGGSTTNLENFIQHTMTPGIQQIKDSKEKQKIENLYKTKEFKNLIKWADNKIPSH